jgi:hypothetical protein
MADKEYNRNMATQAERDNLRDRLEQFVFIDTEYFGSDYGTEVHVYHGPEPTEEALDGGDLPRIKTVGQATLKVKKVERLQPLLDGGDSDE